MVVFLRSLISSINVAREMEQQQQQQHHYHQQQEQQVENFDAGVDEEVVQVEALEGNEVR